MAEFGGRRSAHGDFALLELEPGSTHEVSDDRESGSVLLDGAAQLRTADTVQTLSPGAVIQSSPGERFTLHTTHHQATMLTVYGRASTQPGPDHHSIAPAQDSAARIRISSVNEAADTPVHNPERGFYHMSARTLIDIANGGSRTFTLGQGTFAPGEGCHALHRHPNAAEIFYVWSGEGVHLTEDGTEHPLHTGDLAYISRNEWHGFRNTGQRPVRALFAYLGANSRESAGYELPVAQQGATPTVPLTASPPWPAQTAVTAHKRHQRKD